MYREKERRIGDDYNLVRDFAAMPGRIFDVAFSRDGANIVAGSSYDAKGHVWVFETDNGKKSFELEGEREGISAVACSPDGKLIAFVHID